MPLRRIYLGRSSSSFRAAAKLHLKSRNGRNSTQQEIPVAERSLISRLRRKTLRLLRAHAGAREVFGSGRWMKLDLVTRRERTRSSRFIRAHSGFPIVRDKPELPRLRAFTR